MADETRDQVRAAYGTERFDRLAGLKSKYDPTHFLRHNQNIAPAP
jgi:Berberine and berberine like